MLPQAPALQTWPDTHATAAPQVAPHFTLSEERSRHLPSPQSAVPRAQVLPQEPALQTWPAAQVAPAAAPVQSPKAPQCARSVAGSTQRPPQISSPAWQLAAHAPAEHTWPAVQAVAQAPQWPGSTERSTQRASHIESPVGQVGCAAGHPASAADRVISHANRGRKECGMWWVPGQRVERPTGRPRAARNGLMGVKLAHSA